VPRNGRWDVAVDFSSGSPGNRTIYAAVYHNGVYQSTDGGSTWNAINSGLGSDAQFAWDIVINPLDNQELYLAINSYGLGFNGVYHSTDAGQTWSLLTLPITGDVGCVYVSNTGDVYAGVSDDFDWSISGGLYRSTDHGASWSVLLNNPRIVDIQANPGINNVLLATSQQWYNVSNGEDYGIYLSQDNGNTWQNITLQNINHTVFDFARFNPHNPREVFAGTGGGGLWRTSVAIASTVPEIAQSPDFTFDVYPNPAHDVLHLLLPSRVHPSSYRIINTKGQVAGKGVFSQPSNKTIYISGLASGIYFLEVEANGHTGQVRIVRE